MIDELSPFFNNKNRVLLEFPIISMIGLMFINPFTKTLLFLKEELS